MIDIQFVDDSLPLDFLCIRSREQTRWNGGSEWHVTRDERHFKSTYRWPKIQQEEGEEEEDARLSSVSQKS